MASKYHAACALQTQWLLYDCNTSPTEKCPSIQKGTDISALLPQLLPRRRSCCTDAAAAPLPQPPPAATIIVTTKRKEN